MRLTKIKLSGFKSFADNVTIDLTGNLISIVGPNGCGKSNVIDAIRWVLGESSAKQLRGGAMQDVIFNGSDKRSSVSRASVELFFDNSQEPKIISNSLYATYSEISVKRIITRQGDSEYLINNQNVRRRDIIEMFLGTGVGSRGYAIIEQGMISKIIDSRPEELRLYLEEASGVSKYREKRRETLSKLEYTKDNLTRVHDLQQELAVSIDKLGIQAQKALQYQQLNERLTELNILNGLLRKQYNMAQYQKLEQEINASKHDLESISITKNIIYQDLQLNYEKKELLDNEYSELSVRFNELRATIARQEERVLNNTQRQASLTNEIKQNQLDITRLNVEIDELELQLAAYTEQKSKLAVEIDNNSLGNDNSLLIKDFATKQQELLTKVNQIRDQVTDLRHNQTLILNTYNHKKQQLQNLINQQSKLMQETKINVLDLETQSANLLQELNLAQARLQSFKQEHTDYKSRLDKLKSDKTKIEGQIHLLNNDVSALMSSKQVIKELLATQIVNQELDSTPKLFEVLIIDNKYLNAVNAVLNIYLSAQLVVNYSELLSTNVAIISNNEDIRLIENSLAHVVNLTDSRFNQIYHILNEYILVEDLKLLINNQQNQANIRYVSQNGDILFNGLYIAHNSHQKPNLLYYQTELSSIEKNIMERNNELIKLNAINNALCVEIDELIALIQDSQQNLDEQYEVVNKLMIEQTKLEQNHHFITNHQQKVNLELETISQDLVFSEEELLELTIKLDENSNQLNALTQELNTYQNQLDSVDQTYAKLKEQENCRKFNFDKMKIDILLLEQKILAIDNLKSDKRKQILNLNNKNQVLDYEINELIYQIENNDLAILKDESVDLTTLIEEKTLLIKSIVNKIDELREQQLLIDNQKDKLTEIINTKNLKLQEFKIAIDTLDELLVELNVAQYEINELLNKNTLSINQVQAQISTFKKQIEELGLVNLAAIQDLEEATNKYDKVAAQINDLEQSIVILEGAISKIDETTSKMLYDTYNQVNVIFNNYFRLLFGGGGARLELTDNNILTAGVQIFAQPLGKKNSSIHLLSGGEKALTAVSLVFAFFSLSPSPFCILDEVDAPLDDANILRFCKLVKELAHNTQFIYISHNRLTMEMANQLIGVTMQEKGVSTIVSVKLDSE